MYTLFASVGWLMIFIALVTIFFMILAEGDSNDRVKVILGCVVLIALGVLVARRAEKNIFKALETVIDNNLFSGL